ncbi:FHA domain-containing protein [Schaalia sp. Marseille-Q2122]|uniref:FHA domain-containing protein n=1 Tax=Schaalia sp. Marseille-Q2122 TaxID=2736604 RepID=UPI00158EBB26|nr:FHA domain-containing protein [Schaalia sp. Marseille-Q2122]
MLQVGTIAHRGHALIALSGPVGVALVDEELSTSAHAVINGQAPAAELHNAIAQHRGRALFLDCSTRAPRLSTTEGITLTLLPWGEQSIVEWKGTRLRHAVDPCDWEIITASVEDANGTWLPLTNGAARASSIQIGIRPPAPLHDLTDRLSAEAASTPAQAMPSTPTPQDEEPSATAPADLDIALPEAAEEPPQPIEQPQLPPLETPEPTLDFNRETPAFSAPTTPAAMHAMMLGAANDDDSDLDDKTLTITQLAELRRQRAQKAAEAALPEPPPEPLGVDATAETSTPPPLTDTPTEAPQTPPVADIPTKAPQGPAVTMPPSGPNSLYNQIFGMGQQAAAPTGPHTQDIGGQFPTPHLESAPQTPPRSTTPTVWARPDSQPATPPSTPQIWGSAASWADGQTSPAAYASPNMQTPPGADTPPDPRIALTANGPMPPTGHVAPGSSPHSAPAGGSPVPTTATAYLLRGGLKPIAITEAIVIGRDPDSRAIGGITEAQVYPVPSPTAEVSRSHCAVFYSQGGWMLLDLSSRNGTFIQRASGVREHLTSGLSTPIMSGDIIALGDGVNIEFRIH